MLWIEEEIKNVVLLNKFYDNLYIFHIVVVEKKIQRCIEVLSVLDWYWIQIWNSQCHQCCDYFCFFCRPPPDIAKEKGTGTGYIANILPNIQ